MNYLFTPAFCKPALLEDLLTHLYSKPSIKAPITHVILDNRYPLNEKDAIAEVCEDYPVIYFDSGSDLGLHRSVNQALDYFGVQSEDIFMGCDPDDRPSPGTFDAMIDVMKVDPTIGVLGANFSVIREKKATLGDRMPEIQVAGHNLYVHPAVEMWNVAAFSMPLLNSIGGLNQHNEYYGLLEMALYPRWKERGMVLAYLKDYISDAAPVDRSNPALFDTSYAAWKKAHVGGFRGSFGEWLEVNRKA